MYDNVCVIPTDYPLFLDTIAISVPVIPCMSARYHIVGKGKLGKN